MTNLARPEDPTVVVAVFNALAEVRACIESVLQHTSPPYRLLLIDDHSTDAEVVPVLQDYAVAHPHIDLILNRENRGYTAVINQGCRTASGDVVLLNSDTVVTPGWLEKLAGAAYGRDRVATVTPVSNAAGAFSVPECNVNQELPENLDAAAMGQLVEQLSTRRHPEVPTGNGFCMYVTRGALEEVGYFDEANFPRGYGEENDFCMRALSAGFVNLIDDATFVYHKRSASFGEHKEAVSELARKRLNELHPSYKEQVTQFLANDPLAELRERLGAVVADRGPIQTAVREKPTILFVLHSGQGGTAHTNADLVGSLAEEFTCLVLACGPQQWSLLQHGKLARQIERVEFKRPWRAHEPLSADRRACFRRICSQYAVSMLHIRHLLGSGQDIIAEAKSQDIPVVFSFHDFYTLCPTIHLLDEQGVFCGGHCTAGEGDCPVLPEWFGGLPPLKHRFIHVWRERLGEQLARCDALVTTSTTAHELVTEHYPFLAERSFSIIEHGRDSHGFRPIAVPPTREPVVVACYGALGANKGTALISEVMRLDLAQGRRFEFHFFGGMARAFTPDRWGGIIHGPYQREALASVLAPVNPSFSLIMSTTAETYSHTLTESWMCGLPALVANIGTLQERVLRSGGGWLLDYRDPRGWYEGMLRIDLDDWHRKRAQIDALEFRSVDDMASDYTRIYRQLLTSVSPV